MNQGEAVGGHRFPRTRAPSFVSKLNNVWNIQRPSTHRYGGSHQRAHHGVTEGIGDDCADEHAVLISLPRELFQGANRCRSCPGPAKTGPVVQAETSLTYEAAVIYTLTPNVEIGLTAYQTEFEDKILRVTCAEATAWCIDEPVSSIGRPPTTYVNIDEVRIRGLEATLDARLTDSITFKATGTLTDSEQLTGANAGASLNETPESQASAALTFRPRHSRISGFVRAVYYGEEQQAAIAISGSNILAPAYTTVDVGGSYRLDDKVTLRAGVQNLFNHEMTYEEYGYVNDKARVWAGLTARF